jgi:glycosyltransferase involved in cell wall biosynthesis
MRVAAKRDAGPGHQCAEALLGTRIGVDARLLAQRSRRGVARYEHELLARLPGLDPSVDYVLFTDRPIAGERLPHVRLETCLLDFRKGYRFNVWLQFILPRAARRARVDLLFCPANEPPLWQPVPTVVTVHDVKILSRQKTWLGRHYEDGGRLMPRALAKAKQVITSSRFTRDELARLAPLNGSRVRTIHLGISEAYGPPRDRRAETESLAKRYGVPGRFALALGAAAPYKNTGPLVERFARLHAAGLTPTELVVIGNPASEVEDLTARARRAGTGVHILAYLPQEDLLRFYGCARYFIFPSLYEGFGFPPLEAMASGTPVLVSNRSSIPEVSGDAAEVFDPERDGALEEAVRRMEAICDDPARREAVAARGLEHARRFRWERTAAETVQVFREVLG